MKNWIEHIELESQTIKLIPLKLSHKEDLVEAASDGKLWELWFTSVPSNDSINQYISNALKQKDKGIEYPFAVFHKPTNTIIGSTRFYNIQPEHRRLEIGYTWYAKTYQKTRVNTECKFLLLQYAFETLNCIAVQFLTNFYNHLSRVAIARLGARQDGVLRNHRLMPDGSCRDTVVFSITDYEWSSIKKSLKDKLKSN